MRKGQTHCILRCFCFPSAAEKSSKKGSKTVQNRFPQASYNFSIFLPRVPKARVAARYTPHTGEASPDLKHHATEGQTWPSACGCLCLTSLSELTRNKLRIGAFKPPEGCLCHTEAPCHGRTDLALRLPLPASHRSTMPLKDGPGLRLPLPNVAFWADKKLAQIGAFKPPKRWLRHTETPCHWRVDLAFGLQLPLPNKRQETRSKLEPSSLRHVWLRHTETSCHWRTDQACGCLCLFWTDKKL